MTTEELLKPRYKVIADYPQQRFKIGDILTGIEGYLVKGISPKYLLKDYPAIFRPLQWFEERDVNEMPEYVKMIKHGNIIFKVKSWDKVNYSGVALAEYSDNENNFAPAHWLLPATEPDYLTYINTTQK